jgi:hypothetical protein
MLLKRLCFAALAMFALSLASCSDLGPLVKPKPQAQLSALSLDFGTIAINKSTTRSPAPATRCRRGRRRSRCRQVSNGRST